LLTATLFSSVGIVSPYYLKATTPEQYVKRITSEPVWIDIRDANVIDTVIQINNQLVQHNERLIVAPHWPSLYPILQTKSPLWDIYFLSLKRKIGKRNDRGASS